ncbi:MAG TPA: hypothetical protein PK141_00415 [Polyangiaceae bacterium]|nr:hypothetical protein [Polyangiaceae bacterium]
MRYRIEYADGVYRERVTCDSCGGKGAIVPVYFGEREAPDNRENEPCEACDGAGYTILELHDAEAEAAALYEGILTSRGAA